MVSCKYGSHGAIELPIDAGDDLALGGRSGMYVTLAFVTACASAAPGLPAFAAEGVAAVPTVAESPSVQPVMLPGILSTWEPRPDLPDITLEAIGECMGANQRLRALGADLSTLEPELARADQDLVLQMKDIQAAQAVFQAEESEIAERIGAASDQDRLLLERKAELEKARGQLKTPADAQAFNAKVTALNQDVMALQHKGSKLNEQIAVHRRAATALNERSAAFNLEVSGLKTRFEPFNARVSDYGQLRAKYDADCTGTRNLKK